MQDQYIIIPDEYITKYNIIDPEIVEILIT